MTISQTYMHRWQHVHPPTIVEGWGVPAWPKAYLLGVRGDLLR